MADKPKGNQDAIRDTMARRKHLKETQEYIVDSIFPAGSMHLLGGPSGVGKTTWLFQMLHDWDNARPLFGTYASHPCEWVYISSDRSMRDTTQTLERLGFGDWEFEAHSLEDLLDESKITGGLESPQFNKHILHRFPKAKLVVVEGIQALMPNVPKGMSQNKAELLWAMEARKILAPLNKTIIATTHNPKISAQVSSSDERSKFLGSQGFIGSCSTMIGFEKDATNPMLRHVTVMGRNYADLKLHYALDSNGKYVLEVADGQDANPEEGEDIRFVVWLQHRPANSASSKEAFDYFTKQGMGSERKFRAMLARLRDEGTITSEGKGVKGSTITYQPSTIQ